MENQDRHWLVMIDVGGTLENMPRENLADFIRRLYAEDFAVKIVTFKSANENIVSLFRKSGLNEAEYPVIETGRGRTDPQDWLNLAEDFAPERCIIIDDDMGSLLHARKAGMHIIQYAGIAEDVGWILNVGTPHKVETYDTTLDAFADQICAFKRGTVGAQPSSSPEQNYG